MFSSIQNLRQKGFNGFCSIQDLCTGCSKVPDQPGVYLIIYNDPKSPTFINPGTGGYFKGKNPNVLTNVLESKWVNDTVVIYIGQAGGNGSSSTLRKRIWQYIRFGHGVPIGHYGGRYLWQLKDSGNLLICWKPSLCQDSRELEARLIQDFKFQYGKLPFANIST